MIYRFLIGLAIVLLQRGRFRQEKFKAIYRPLVKYPQFGRPYLLCFISVIVAAIGGFVIALAVDPEWFGIGVIILGVVTAACGLGHFEKRAMERYSMIEPDNWRPPDATTIRDVLRRNREDETEEI